MLDSIRNIAFFPLNICLLPGEDIPLKIFEPRYKQLINDCDNDKFSFGIPFIHKNEMQMFGTEVMLKQVIAKNTHGEMVIMVEGIGNFELLRFNDRFQKKLYSGGLIRSLQTSFNISNKKLNSIIGDYTVKLDPEFLKDHQKGKEYNSDVLARALNLSSEDKFKYLSLDNSCDRESFLLKQIEYLYKIREQENLLDNDFYLN